MQLARRAPPGSSSPPGPDRKECRARAYLAALRHPLEVGALLHMSGYPEHVVTAGLLHDILESSDTTALELRMRFGAPIARLVEMVSEDPAVEDRVERKARLRQQVAGAGPEAAAISAADKLSKVREYDASGHVLDRIDVKFKA